MEAKQRYNAFTVMTSPRLFIRERRAVKAGPLILLSWLYGLIFLFDYSLNQSLGYNLGFWQILVTTFFLAPLAGFIAIMISSILLLWTGKILKGKATFWQIVTAVSWSKVPQVFILLTWLLLFCILGSTAFAPQPLQSTPLIGAVAILFWVQLALYVWSFIILLHMLAEVQQFSAWIALWNVIFKALILGVLGFIFITINQNMIYPPPLGIIIGQGSVGGIYAF